MERMDVRVARLRGFLSVDSSNSDLACELADLLLEQGATGEAEAALESLSPPANATPGVRFRLARIALASGRYETAGSLLQALIEAGHDHEAVMHDLAFVQLCQRDCEAAATTIHGAIARHGASASLRMLAARIALMQERRADAIALLDQTLAEDPGNIQAQGIRALAFLDDSRHPQAAEAALGCLLVDGDQHEALLVAGTLALWGKQVDVAETYFARALERYPNSGRVLSGMGQCAMLRDDLVTARITLESAVRAMPDHIGTWHALAWTQLLQGEHDVAEASYQHAYALDRNFADTHGGLALIALLRGDATDAERSIQRALRLDPNAITARYAKSLLLQSRGDDAGADALLRVLIGEGGGMTLPIREFGERLKQRLTARRH
jgi:tetratricopeptide (TPR) repeat protein